MPRHIPRVQVTLTLDEQRRLTELAARRGRLGVTAGIRLALEAAERSERDADAKGKKVAQV